MIVFGSVLRVWQKLRQQLSQLGGNERLLQDRPPCAGQEPFGRGAQGVGGDESGARAKMRPVLGYPVVQSRPIQPRDPFHTAQVERRSAYIQRLVTTV